jgi:hypothetical protein
MMEWLSVPANLNVALAAMTALATLFAAIAAIFGPMAAVRLQARIAGADEQRKLKLHIFVVLMQYRDRWGWREPSNMLNLIDVVFARNKMVRAIWHDFYRMMDRNSGYSFAQKQDKFRDLLNAIASDIGLSTQLDNNDYTRIYYSDLVSAEDEARYAQSRATLALAAEAANAATNQQQMSTTPALAAQPVVTAGEQ